MKGDNFVRRANPDCVLIFVKKIHRTFRNKNLYNVKVSIGDLVDALMDQANYKKGESYKMVQYAIHDGLLVPIAVPASKRQKEKLVRFAQPEDVQHRKTRDVYCFECHLPGELVPCRQCLRGFHRICYRQDPEVPNAAVVSDAMETSILASRSSSSKQDETIATANIEEKPFTVDTKCETTIQQSKAEQELNSADRAIKKEYDSDSADAKIFGADVICLGETRPPTRQRNIAQQHIKIDPNDAEESSDLDLCTVCRLSKIILQPPNINSGELCHLLKFTFIARRSIVKTEVSTYLSCKLSAAEIILISELLFIKPVLSLKDIQNKLYTSQYTDLSAFIADILDLKHNVGIFFGARSSELKKFHDFVGDITKDITEIRRCSDCVRHSYEKISPMWFALPCRQRHELVYAKTGRCPYWPAKIMNVLPNGHYEVRFFGGKHTRATVNLTLPFDTDMKSLKLPHSAGLKRAIVEMNGYRTLINYGPAVFSYQADKKEVEGILKTVFSPNGNNDAQRVRASVANNSTRNVSRSNNVAGNNNNNNNNHNNNDNDNNISSISNMSDNNDKPMRGNKKRSSSKETSDEPCYKKRKLCELNEQLNLSLRAKVDAQKKTIEKLKKENNSMKRCADCQKMTESFRAKRLGLREKEKRN